MTSFAARPSIQCLGFERSRPLLLGSHAAVTAKRDGQNQRRLSMLAIRTRTLFRHGIRSSEANVGSLAPAHLAEFAGKLPSGYRGCRMGLNFKNLKRHVKIALTQPQAIATNRKARAVARASKGTAQDKKK